MSYAGRLKAVLGLDNGPFKQGLHGSKGAVRGFVGAVRGMMAPLAAAMGAAMSVNAVRNAMSNIDAQAKLARSLGTTVESMQVLERAGELAGVGMAQMEQGTKDLFRRLSQAATGTGPAKDALKRLGLSAEDLLKLPLDQRLSQINGAINQFVPAAQRAAVAGALFGEEGAISLSRLDPEVIATATKELHAFGYAISETDASKIEEANDALSKIGLSTSALGNRVAVGLAPFLTELSRGFAEMMRQGSAFNAWIGGIGQNLAGFTSVAFDLVRIVSAAAVEFAGWFKSMSQGEGVVASYLSYVGMIVDTSKKMVSAIGGTISFFSDLIQFTGGFGEAMAALKPVASEVWDRIKLGVQSLSYAISARWKDIKASVLDALDGALTGVVTFGNRALGSFVGAYEGIKAAWAKLPAAIGDLVIKAANTVIGGVESLLNGVIDRINSFVGGINGILSALPDWAGGSAKVGLLDAAKFDRITNEFAGAASDAGAAAGEAFSTAFNHTYFDGPEFDLAKDAASERSLASTYRGIADSLQELAGAPLDSVEALRTQLADAAKEAEGALTDAEAASDDLGDSLQETGTGGASALSKAKNATSEVSKGLKAMRDAGKSAFVSLVTGAKSLRAAISDLLAKWAEMAASRLFDSLFSGGGSGGFWASLFGVSKASGASKASGMAAMATVPKVARAMVPVSQRVPVRSSVHRAAPMPARTEISVVVDGARGDQHIIDLVEKGVGMGISQYDRKVLPSRVQDINRKPRRK